jgi:hypothetical protein
VDEHTAVLVATWLDKYAATAKIQAHGRPGFDDWTITLTAHDDTSHLFIDSITAYQGKPHLEKEAIS